ncbi:MAG: GLUG motif-containing protein [Halobacteriales archaeon]|nr:GLUG motif-containing protein [Halobacteriales archaeon]
MEKKNRADRYRLRFAVPIFVVLTVVLLCFAAVGTVTAQEDISNAQELQDIRDDLDGDYVLTDDIDASSIGNFDPIGGFDSPFTGTFDGDGHKITGLTIDRSDEFDIGLFGAVGSGGSVENVGVENVDIDGSQWVGGLVGYNQGEITDSYATGEVVADTRVGGLVGGNEGSITESYAEGDVTSVDIAGGLVGNNMGDIEESYAEASVAGFEGTTARDMGGLVGINDGEVEDSYARGEVLGDRFLGGLVGASDGDIVGSYATGEVVGDEDTGGLVGDLNFGETGAVLRDSYWDEDTTTQTDSFGTESGSPTVQNVEGLQTDEMQGDVAETNMDEFDFTTTWRTVTNPDGYPVLAWQVGADDEPAPVNFGVTIDSTNSPVSEGETLTVDTTVENTGDESGTQTVSLTVGGTVRDPVDVTLDGGSSTTETLGWTTGDGDVGDYTATVGSEDDSDTTQVTVESTDTSLISINNPDTVLTDGEFDFTVEMTDSSVGEVAVESSDFGVNLSVVDDAGDSIGSQTDTNVEFIDIDEETSTYTLNVDVTGGSEGDTGTITAATGGNIGDSGVAQTSSTFTVADASSSPVEGVSDALWTAVTQNDNNAGLSLADLGNAIQQYQVNPSDADVGGASITLSDLGSLIQYYQNQVA